MTLATLRAESVASALLFRRVAHAMLYALIVGIGIGAVSMRATLAAPTPLDALIVSAISLVAVDVLAVRPAGWYLAARGGDV
jgi:hypothetical protein